MVENEANETNEVPKKQTVLKVHWRQSIGNPYLQGLTPDMLTPEGAIILRLVKSPKEREHIAPKTMMAFHYDREFVEEFLIRRFFEPLEVQPAQYNDVQKIIIAAWRTYRKRQEQALAEVEEIEI